MRFGRHRGAWLALGLVVLCPALARADALDGAFMVLQLWAAIWGLALLLMLFSVLAYRQPTSPTLRVLNLVGVGISLLLAAAGLLIDSKMGSAGGLASLGSVNPFLNLSLPLAACLGGASHAASATESRTRQWAVAVAGAGGRITLGVLLNMGMRALLPDSLSMEYPYLYWVLGLLVSAGVWWLVMRRAQRQQPLAWQLPAILWVAALSAVLGTVYGYLPVLLFASSLDTVWFSQALSSFFTYGLVNCAVSVLVIWLQQRRYRP